MKIFFTIIVLFYSSSIFSIEWDSSTLQPVFEGCVQNSSDGSDYEYCGCYVNGISKNFTVLQVVELSETGELESNEFFLSIIEECVNKLY
tara:strand:+ start:2827 stop:3096 length:270 start_codon:yes stop_codon:yes gene_type:complete